MFDVGLLLLMLLASAESALAGVRYVDVNSASPAPPYTTWATAAATIQQAVDAAAPGDEIVVTNGTYATGGRAVGTNVLVNRVAVDKPLTMHSVNGPQVTVIQGYQVPGTTNGDGAIRCVYLTNGASLSGFTLTSGATRKWRAGDRREECGGGLWCESAGAVASNCTLTANSAGGGGGAYSGTLNNCVLSGNSAQAGGGAFEGTLNNCTLTGNSGGGANGCTLNNCTLTGNSADYGGGAVDSTLDNCTLTGNSAGVGGGGTYSGTLNNCIVYFNTAPQGANYSGGTLNYCCTTPLPWSGVGNLSLDPQLASPSHLSATSPCRGAGSAAYATGVDIDGEAWGLSPSIGCDEYHAGAVTGPLSVGFVAVFTNVAAGFTIHLAALIEGRTTASCWDFGDGVVVSNQPYATHAWTDPGSYAVILRAYNESLPGGVSATVTVHVVALPVHYVAADSPNPLPPYTSWATAAPNIQDAVDAATVPGAWVLVANGTYATGGRAVYGTMTNRVAVDKPLELRSVNGPQVTVIQGYQVPGTTNGDGAIRCVYLKNGATLSGFTLTNGATRSTGDSREQSGGGLWCEPASTVVSNCMLTGNSAYEGGGGAFYGTLNHCTLAGNSARFGGGASYSTLNHCTLTGNSAEFGGGAGGATLGNCTLSGNSAFQGGGASGGTLNNCTLVGNSADYAGGASDSTLNNSTLAGNSADWGGGAAFSTLNNCTLAGNSAGGDGGGAAMGTLKNCTLTGNSAGAYGGGASGGTLHNCTLTGNSAFYGGGATGDYFGICTLNNCIVYFNTAQTGANYYHAWLFSDAPVMNYCCTTPMTANGVGNLTNEPGFVDAAAGNYRLRPGSPCIDAGTNLSAILTSDLDGRPRPVDGNGDGLAVFDIGAYEYGALLVWQGSPSPAPPYATWSTAAHTIQDAVDAAAPGDEIVVTNGTYATGGRAVGTNVLVNRVAVDKPLTLRSVNGPEFTVIQGYQVPGTTNGDGAIRCVYLTNGASLSGFTLTNGATRSAGDYQREQSGGGAWCESSGVMTNCVLSGNSAAYGGGGAYGGTLNNCTLSGNAAGGTGGGAAWSTLNNCTLTGNSAAWGGGGANSSTLNNCTLTGNSAYDGGGAAGGTLNHCVLSGNSAVWFGGGAYGGELNNCTLTGNSADSGGGVCEAMMNGGTLNNCIVYFNTAQTGANYWFFVLSAFEMNYCCTTPLPAGGTGNISLDPQLASASHLSATSSCRGAGSAAYATGADIDGEPWASPPSIGCDEYHAGSGARPLSVAIVAAFTNVAVGFPLELTALIDGLTTASVWEFGDGLVASNRPYAAHAWVAPGDYVVVLRAYNDNRPEGVSATVTVHVAAQPVHYVAADAANPLPPYISWATAARNIQDAVDVASTAGALVLVTNGIYTAGGRAVVGTMTNRVAVDKPLALWSVNGAQFTVIHGGLLTGEEIRCVYLTNGASLSGFTLTNGATRGDGDWWREQNGGGLWCERTAVASNCVVAGNSAAAGGGGAYSGTLNNCTLTGNSASSIGGGACFGTLNNCTLTGNSASAGSGGGASEGTLNNCTLTGNSAYYGGGANYGTLNNCVLVGNSAQYGGGAAGSTLNNCTLTGNSAVGGVGGGAWWGTLNNCTLTGNSATGDGGGANSSTLNNCIVYFNTAANGANYSQEEWTVLNFCCTTPLPTNGVGNITNAPLFVNYAGGNLRLQSNSPCINAGLNAHAPGPTDLDGLPRIVSGTVDIGAYEFQGSGSVISYAWLQRYGLPTDGSADATDPDADGHNTWQEWQCGTCPTNALLVLRLLAAWPDGTHMTVSWQSVAGVNYFLERSTNLSATPRFTPLATNLPGLPGTTAYTDTNAAGAGPFFYRVGVGN
jgi:hypothetical protein